MSVDRNETSPLLLTGSRTHQRAGYSWYRRLKKPWGLLLSLNDAGTISVGEQSYDIPAGTLVVYRPDVPCKFTARDHWEYIWFHFPLRSHMVDEMIHEEILPGLGAVTFKYNILKTVIDELTEVCELEKIHRPGWEALALLLIESILQRFSYYCDYQRHRHRSRIEKAVILLTADKCGKIGSVAAACGMSEPLLYALFRKEMGCSPREYREQFLLRKAKSMLLNSSKGIDEISEECGMCDRYYFSNRFKKLFGISPAAFRKNAGS